jgi:hypothetical protein
MFAPAVLPKFRSLRGVFFFAWALAFFGTYSLGATNSGHLGMKNDSYHLYAPYMPQDFCLQTITTAPNNLLLQNFLRVGTLQSIFLFAIHYKLQEADLPKKLRKDLILAKRMIYQFVFPVLVGYPVGQTMPDDFWEKLDEQRREYQLLR